MNDRAARAARRRQTWTGGVVTGFQQAELADFEFWRAATPEERVQGVTDLVLELLDSSGAPRRLDKSIGGVRKRRLD
ncbi:MAG: hypothetical protein H6718_14695 [Polyangiaceae bacterium]|nr:hypothetical protein [Myxococcales bacterium]MCB9586646.1 hypothetical protein [Polyangiaceae bacterium]MCB9606153.1 hypothetical protein [Polyangiaceae bacterium]